jgi:CubicO group peptidase (beta-lactamase class C family)
VFNLRWAIGIFVVLAIAAGGVMAYAPYLPQLVTEGVPPLVGPGVGHFADLSGAQVPRDLHPADDAQSRPLVPELAAAFADKRGKALLVFRDGELALEHYAEGLGPETRFNSFSMAKSLVGALVYKALAEGRLTSLDQTLGDLLPQDEGLKAVTIRQLLEMRSGIAFDAEGGKLGGVPSAGKEDDTAPNPFGPLARLHFAGLASIERGLTVAPGDTHEFSYQNVNTALLGEVLETAYGRPLADLLDEKLWRPAGAAGGQWREAAAGGSVSAYCCIYATARDWVRVGLFLSENGGSTPFLPTPLWREFLGLDVPVAERHDKTHYGSHIWQDVLDRPGQALQGSFTYLMGQGGQMLYLMPDKGVVVYRAGDGIQLLHSTFYGAWNSLG